MKFNLSLIAVLSPAIFVSIFLIILEPWYYHYDDAFITYLFAKHLGSGHGIVFHSDTSPVQGSSSPLYVALLALAFKATAVDVHKIGLIFSTAFFGLWCVLGVQLTSQGSAWNRSKYLFLLTLLTFQAPVLFSLGMETLCFILSQTVALILVTRSSRTFSTGLAVAVSVLLRPETVIFIPVFVYLARCRGCQTLPIVLWPLVSIGIYLTLSYLYFGAATPQPWIAKRYFPVEVSGVLSWANFFLNNKKLSVYFGGLLVVVAVLCRRKAGRVILSELKPVGIILSASLGLSVLLSFKNAPDMPWYYVPSISFGYLFLVGTIFRHLSQEKYWVQLGVTGLFVYASVISGLDISSRFDGVLAKKRGALDRREVLGRYLASEFPDIANKTILLYEAGKIPYFSGAHAVDVLGLVSPESVEGLQRKDPTYTFDLVEPDFVAGVPRSDYFPMKFISSPTFLERYRAVKRFGDYLLWKRCDAGRCSSIESITK